MSNLSRLTQVYAKEGAFGLISQSSCSQCAPLTDISGLMNTIAHGNYVGELHQPAENCAAICDVQHVRIALPSAVYRTMS